MMPRYFFDLYNDVDTLDPEGIELPNDAAAYEHAVCEARAMAAASAKQGHIIGRHRIEIRGDDGDLVKAVRFDEAVAIDAGQ